MADDSVARGLLGLALLQMHVREYEEDAAPFIRDWMAKYPEPEKVDKDFLVNLLVVPNVSRRKLLAAGEEVPEGFDAWRRDVLEAYERSLPVETWRLVASHPEVVPSASELKRAIARGSDDVPLMKQKVWAASVIFSERIRWTMQHVDEVTDDLSKRGLDKKYFTDDKEIVALMKRIRSALDVAGEYPRGLQESLAIHEVKDRMLAELRAAPTATEQARTGTNAYGAGYGSNAIETRQDGASPLVTVRSAWRALTGGRDHG